LRQVWAVRASINVRPVLNGRASLCTADRSNSGKVCADVGTARLMARGAWRGRDPRPVKPLEIKVPEPWRLST
jgi:hypothetical protein